MIPDTYELFWMALNTVEEDHGSEVDVLDIIEAIREAIHENQGREIYIAHVQQSRIWEVFAELGRKITAFAEKQNIPREWLNR